MKCTLFLWVDVYVCMCVCMPKIFSVTHFCMWSFMAIRHKKHWIFIIHHCHPGQELYLSHLNSIVVRQCPQPLQKVSFILISILYRTDIFSLYELDYSSGLILSKIVEYFFFVWLAYPFCCLWGLFMLQHIENFTYFKVALIFHYMQVPYFLVISFYWWTLAPFFTIVNNSSLCMNIQTFLEVSI